MPKHLGFATAALACGLALSGCSSGSGSSTMTLPISPASTDAAVRTRLPESIASVPLREARRLRAHVVGTLLSMPWRLVNVHSDGRVLVVYYVSGDGIRPHGVNNIGFRVIERPASVELIAVSRDENHGAAEAASLATGAAKITLSRPLGTRKLLHAPTASGWPATLLKS